MKKLLLLTMCFASACTFAQTAKTDMFKKFEHRITPREVKTVEQLKEEKTRTPSELAIRKLEASLKEKPVTDGRFKEDWSNKSVLKINKAEEATAGKEQLDSVIRVGIDGKAWSKQELSYTETGNPLHCDNYVPDDATGQWKKVGYYDYQYDNLGRVVSSTSLDETGFNENSMYEYLYSDNTPYYTSQILYSYDNGEWTPVQKGDYAYDKNFNTIDEAYSYYNIDEADWTPSERKTATYDDENRMTSYNEYVWDATAGEWVGNEYASIMGQKFEYDEEGRDKVITYSTWKNGAWLDYERDVNTYNDNGTLAFTEVNYWNESRNDWSGGYVQVYPSGYEETYYNQRYEYSYDDKNRETKQEVYNQNFTGNWGISYRLVSEYEDDDKGGYNSTKTEYMRLSASTDLSVYSITEQSFNKFGAETYYKAYRYNGSETPAPIQEEIRIIDEYNNYHGGFFYGFMQNDDGTYRRYGVSNEQYTFADDWNPAAGFDTPILGLHQNGVSNMTDTEWVDYSLYEYTWENQDVLAGYQMSYYVNGVKVPTVYNMNKYDYNTSIEDICLWPSLTPPAPYKMYTSENYANIGYDMGEQDWTPSSSYTDTYYYSDITPTGISRPETTTAEGAKEVARYNLSGQRVDQSVKGIVIIKYDDGSTRKIINR